jgi:type IV pilus assembly protein PilB
MNKNTALYDNLLAMGVLDSKLLDDCRDEAESSGQDLADVLENRDLVSNDNLGRLTADYFQLSFVNLAEIQLKRELVTKIPKAYSLSRKCLLIGEEKDAFVVAVANPEDKDLLEELEVALGKVKYVYATDRDVRRSIRVYDADPQTMFETMMKNTLDEAKNGLNDPPIIKIVEKILVYGYEQGASDIHIEPTEEATHIRYRVDGLLVDVLTIPKELHEKISTRIKVMAHMRTDEQHSAQDGKLTFETDIERVDVRVSIVPIIEGENVVLRLLSAQSRQYSLLDLGLNQTVAKKIEEAIKSPHGMILATGPTGSGKTTSLYALLKRLNVRGVHIMTIEDPVEYVISGVNQIQVNEANNLTFAEGLRSIVRQDPNIILVGEIRDNEAADIAVNAAMTGHLVLSTIHTNDAATTIPRLLDMNVEPFLIASTVNVIVAQRLVRKLCNNCRMSEEVEISELQKKWNKELIAKHFGKDKVRLYKSKGCEVCNGTGYRGRVGIFEVLKMSEALRTAIVEKKDASEIEKIAIVEGMQTMFEDGIDKVKNGATNLEEILRVTRE